MPVNQAQRTLFYEGQYLGAEDLTQAIDYGRIQDSRHELSGHTWGIAIGLGLREMPSVDKPGEVVVTVQPGYAWDGFGRPIVVSTPSRIPPERLQSIPFDPALDGGNPAGRLVDVWIRYREFDTAPPDEGFALCDGPERNTRVQESFQIEAGRYTLAARRDNVTIGGVSTAPNLALQRFDATAPLLYDESAPHQEFPLDDPEAWWLVPVGKVRWLPNVDPTQPGSFLALSADDALQSARVRQYIGAVAGSVEAPEGVLRLKDRRLAKNVIPSDDLVWVEGKLRVNGDARLFGGALDLRDSSGGSDATPLKVRRVGNASGGQDLQATIGQMNPASNRFQVGPLNAAGAMTASVTVLDSGNVGIGTDAPAEKLHVSGGKVQWGDSLLDTAEGGSIELGGNDNAPGTGSPHIDFHFKGLQQDFNTRLVNDADGRLRVEAQVLSAAGRVGVGTNAPGEAVEIAAGGNLLLKAAGDAAGAVVFEDSAGVQKARIWSRETTGAGLYLSSGDATPDVTIDGAGNVGIGTTTPLTKLDVVGGIRSDRWNVAQLLSNATGPLPIDAGVTTHGGTLVVFASGSGKTSNAPGEVGMTILVDNVVRGAAACRVNQNDSHQPFVANALVVAGLGAGSHTIRFAAQAGTLTESHDRYSLTVMELPF